MTSIPRTSIAPDVVAELWPAGESRQVNHGSFGRVPAPIVAELHQLIDEEQANAQAWFRTITDRIGQSRTFLSNWIGADPSRTGLVTNASAGMTLAIASAVQGLPQPRIVYTSQIYGAVEYAIQRTVRLTDGEAIRIDVPLAADDQEVLTLLKPALDNADLLVVDQITSATAKLMPVAELTALARAAGVAIAIDGAHVPGLLERPLEGIADADFWTGNFHKWPCAPRGTAALVVNESRLDTVPLIASWSEHFSMAERFDRQGTNNWSSVLAAPKAIELIERRLGWDTVRAHMAELAPAAQALLCESLGTTVPEVGTPALSMRLVPLPAGIVTNPDQAAALQTRIATEQLIETSITSYDGQGFVRVSAHAYNTLDDFAQLAAALRWVLN